MAWFDIQWIPYIVFGCLILGSILYFNHLQGKVNNLETQLQNQKQKEVALKDSLKTIKEYADSLGNARKLEEIADIPVMPDENVVEDENVRDEIGDSESQTETTFSVSEDTVTGGSRGEKLEELEKEVWRHDITRETSLYNFNVHLDVYSPGDSLDYTISASTKEIKLRFFQYTDDEGIRRTAIDSPIGIDVSGLRTRYRAETEQDEFEHLKFELPLLSASNITGLKMGGGLKYRTGELFGMRLVLRGSLTYPVPGVPQPEVSEDLPPLSPQVEAAISF